MVKLLQGDCIERMSRLAEGSIDLTITSPPYDRVRSYRGNNNLWGEHVWKEAIAELYRVTKPGGVVVWVVGDATVKGSETGTSFKQALWAIECGFMLYDTMIYRKLNRQPLNHKRYEQEFEFMFIFSKGKPATVNLIQVPCKHAGKRNTGTSRNGGSDRLQKKHGFGKPYKETKSHGNIFEYPIGVEPDRFKVKHPAKFPEKLVYDQIITWSNPGEVVLDCFAGSGTTGIVAYETKRDCILIELEIAYCDIIRNRFKDRFDVVI